MRMIATLQFKANPSVSATGALRQQRRDVIRELSLVSVPFDRLMYAIGWLGIAVMP